MHETETSPAAAPWESYGPEVPRPDWDYWALMDSVELGEAVALALDIDPKSLSRFFDNRAPAGSPAWLPRALSQGQRLADIAWSNLHSINGPKSAAAAKALAESFELDWSEVQVQLQQFAAWARGRRLPLPSRFPGAGVEAVNAARIAVSAPGESIELPHMPARLRELLAIMRENFESYDPANPPKQEAIAREIAQRLDGREPKEDGDLRSAKTLAALIRPDALRASDERLKPTRDARRAKGTRKGGPESR